MTNSSRFDVVAQLYCGNSMYCRASTPGYQYIVAIPLTPGSLPEEARAELWKNAPQGESYFVFETARLGGVVLTATTAPMAVGMGHWHLCSMEVREQGGLRFVSE